MLASAPELPSTGSPPRELNTAWVESPFFEEIHASRIVNDDAPLFTTGVEGARVQDGWKKRTSIARLASLPRVLAMLEFLYGLRCHIITVTTDLLKKLPMLGRDLGDLSLDTVRMFHRDAVAAG